MGVRCLRCLRRRSSWARRSRCCAEGRWARRRRRSRWARRQAGLLRDRVSARFRTVLAPAAMGAALGAMLDAPLAGVVFSFEALRRRPGSLASLAAPAVTSLVSWSVVRAMGVRFLPGSVAAPAVLDVVLAGDSFMGDRVVGALLLLAAVGAAAGLLALAFCGALGKLRGGLAGSGRRLCAGGRGSGHGARRRLCGSFPL